MSFLDDLPFIDGLKRRLEADRGDKPWQVPPQDGRRYIVTGANSGLGREAARRLAGAGADVVMAVRNEAKGRAARDELLADQPDAKLELEIVDLGSLASIKEFAERFAASGKGVDVLVNNAGVMTPPERLETKDGFEMQFGTNFLGALALTNRLLPTLLKGDKPRVVTMGSIAAMFGSIDMADLEWRTRTYRPFGSYAQSKLADLLLGSHLSTVSAQRGWPLISTMAHPGFTTTQLLANGQAAAGHEPRPEVWMPNSMRQSVEIGVDPLLRAAADPTALSGEYYGPADNLGVVGPAVPVKLPRSARKPELAANLWIVGEALTKTKLPD